MENGKKSIEEKAYEDYLDRLSMPPCIVDLTDEEIEELKKQGCL